MVVVVVVFVGGVRERSRPAWSYWTRVDVGGKRKEMRAEWKVDRSEVVFVLLLGGECRGAGNEWEG